MLHLSGIADGREMPSRYVRLCADARRFRTYPTRTICESQPCAGPYARSFSGSFFILSPGFCMRLGLHRDRRPNSRVATPGGFLVAIAVVSFGRGLLCHARLRYADRWGSPRNEPRPGPKLII